MTIQFKPIPPDLYKSVEAEAGTILPPLKGRHKRATEQFDPDWEFLLTGRASKAAVVACVSNSQVDVPERIWPRIVEIYCPQAWALLTAAGVSFEAWRVGESPAGVGSAVSAMANVELDGYAVFAVMDIGAMQDHLIEVFGQHPRFA